MTEGDKSYTLYRGGRDRGSVPEPADGKGQRPWRPWRRRAGGRRRVRVALLAGGLLLGAILFLVGWGVAGYVVLQGGVGNAGKRIDRATRSELAGGGGALFSHSTTILLIGTDHSDNASRAGDRHADSLMLVRTDPSRHRIAYLSIPRDLYVDISSQGRQKINAAYQIGGAALQLRAVKDFTGLAVNHVAVVDFGSFSSLIDAIGGVTVTNDKEILSNRFDCPFTAEKCRDWKGWRFAKGKITLDGRRALAYARVRENRLDAGDTDFTRGARQQQVISAVGDKLASVGTFFRLPFVGDKLLEPLATDLSAWDLLQLGWVRFRAASGKALHCRLGGDPGSTGSGSVILPTELNRLVVQMFTGRSAPQPPPPGGTYQPGCTVGRTLAAGGT